MTDYTRHTVNHTDEELAEKVKEKAKETDRSLSGMYRHIVKEYFK